MRKRFYRLAFSVSDDRVGSILILESSVEMAISRAAQAVGNGFIVHSVNPLFMTDSEERDFMHFVVKGLAATDGDIVDIQKRLRGE